MKIMTTKLLLTIAILALCACGPGHDQGFPVGDDTGSDTSGTPADGSTTPDLGDGCSDDFVFECDAEGRCWAIAPGWGAWAQYADPALVTLVNASAQFTMTSDDLGIDGDCYDVTSTDAHVCVVMVDCVPLLTRPLTEINVGDPSDCAMDVPWDASANGDGTCWGQLATTAVEIRP